MTTPETLIEEFTRLQAENDEEKLESDISNLKKALLSPEGDKLLTDERIQGLVQNLLQPASHPLGKSLALQLLSRPANKNLALIYWEEIAQSLADRSIRIADQAALLLVKLSVDGNISAWLPLLRQVAELGSTENVRVLGLVAEIGQLHPEFLTLWKDDIDFAFNSVPAMDLLEQTSILSLVAPLLSTEQGQKLLRPYLESLLRTAASDPVLLASYLHTLASTCETEAKATYVLDAVPSLLPLLKNMLEGSEEVAVVLLGVLGQRSVAFTRIMSNQALLDGFVSLGNRRVGDSLASWLHTAAHLLASAGETGQLEALYKLFTTKPQPLVRFCEQVLAKPVLENRLAVYAVWQSLAQFPAGIKLLLQPGIVEYLLNRGTETTKEGAEWKFAIMSHLAKSEVTQEAVGALLAAEVRNFVRCVSISLTLSHGVFWAPPAQAQPEVATLP